MRPYIFIYLILFVLSSCARSSSLSPETQEKFDYDVSLEATPMTVKALGKDSVIDVLETEDAAKMKELNTVVVFRIEKVLKGEFTRIKRGGPTEWKQAQNAIGQGQLIKLVTLDFTDPDDVVDKKWISVAVENVWQRFEILDWENPPKQPIRLYLKRIPENPNSYLLAHSELPSKKPA